MLDGHSDGIGWIDYTLARRSVLADLASGRVARAEVCDCHPELMRVARHHGEPAQTECPVCAATETVTVSFAFGDRLARRNGRFVRADEMSEFLAIPGVSCYTVEVCTECAWNHLLRSHGEVDVSTSVDATASQDSAGPTTDAD